MDLTTALLVSLVVSTLAGWVTSWLLSIHAEGIDKGPKAIIVLIGATAIGVPAEWMVDAALEHAFATGVLFLAAGLAGAACCAVLHVRGLEA